MKSLNRQVFKKGLMLWRSLQSLMCLGSVFQTEKALSPQIITLWVLYIFQQTEHTQQPKGKTFVVEILSKENKFIFVFLGKFNTVYISQPNDSALREKYRGHPPTNGHPVHSKEKTQGMLFWK